MKVMQKSRFLAWTLQCLQVSLWTTAACGILVAMRMSLLLWAQASPSSFVGAAVNGHGAGWQNGAVKTWMAVGTLTTYRYVEDPPGRNNQGHILGPP